MPAFLGISGEHQRSTALYVDQSGYAETATGGTINLHSTDLEHTAFTLGNLLNALARRIGCSSLPELAISLDKVVFSLPGAGTRRDQRKARRCLELCGWPHAELVQIVDDTWAALVGGTQSGFGISAVSGTGASVFVGLGEFVPVKSQKLDGWGPLLGDRGSGFDLATRLLSQITAHYDTGDVSPLFAVVKEYESSIGEVEDIPEWLDNLFIDRPHDWRSYIGRLASCVTAAAESDGPGRAEAETSENALPH